MKSVRMILAVALALAVGALGVWSPRADAQAQTIKIGLLYDHSGPFSAAGSLNCWRGAKMIIDYVNEKGGVLGKYKIVQVDGDSQSKAEVAINEAERLLNVDKVDILAGGYSSAHPVPLAEKGDKQKKLLCPGARSELARDEASRRAPRRPLSHRLCARHRAVPAPGQGAGPPREDLHRARRRPQPAPEAEGSLRHRGGGIPHGRSARRAADRSEEAEAGCRGAHAGDAEALQDLRADHPRRPGGASRLDGLQQHVDPPQRRAAARDPEARRLLGRGARQGRAGDGHPRGRHDAGLRREVPSPRARHGRPEHARHRRRLPGRRRGLQARVPSGRREHERTARPPAGVLAAIRALSAAPRTSRSATAPPGRSERGGVWGAISGPPISRC